MHFQCPGALVCQCHKVVSVCVVQPEADIRRICVVCPKACVGHPKVCVGCPKVCVGCPKVCVGRPKICVGRPKVCVGRPKACVGVMIIWWGNCPEVFPRRKRCQYVEYRLSAVYLWREALASRRSSTSNVLRFDDYLCRAKLWGGGESTIGYELHMQ